MSAAYAPPNWSETAGKVRYTARQSSIIYILEKIISLFQNNPYFIIHTCEINVVVVIVFIYKKTICYAAFIEKSAHQPFFIKKEQKSLYSFFGTCVGLKSEIGLFS